VQSWFVQKDEVTNIQLAFGVGGFGAAVYANFNLTTGAVGTTSNLVASGIEDCGDYYRCWAAATATATLGTYAAIACLVGSDSATYLQAYAGDGTSGLYIWGAQLEEI
jgi:hypothetical protein